MSKRPRILRSKRKMLESFVVVNPDAAGIDAGSEQHWVSVPEDRDEPPERDLPAPDEFAQMGAFHVLHAEERDAVDLPAGHVRAGRHGDQPALALDGEHRPGP